MFVRTVYDDVLLLCSEEPDAHTWLLEVRAATGWCAITPRLIDANLNWSTSDLGLWPSLCENGIKESSHLGPSVVAPMAPYAVMWDLSDWHFDRHPDTGRPYEFRVTRASGAAFGWRGALSPSSGTP